MHLRQVLAAQLLPRIAISFRLRLLFLFLLALERVETQRLICAHGIDVSGRKHEACASNGRAMVDNLVQRVILLSLSDVKDVDQTICARGQQ
jgi:hypothetical protein